MAPKQRQKIEIEKTHRDPLLSFNQAVTVDCSDFLLTALNYFLYLSLIANWFQHEWVRPEPANGRNWALGHNR